MLCEAAGFTANVKRKQPVFSGQALACANLRLSFICGIFRRAQS